MSVKESHSSDIAKTLLLSLWNIIGFLLSLILIIIIGLFTINIFVISSTHDQIWDAPVLKDKHADFIVVLGAGLDKNGEPSPILAERLNKGAELLELKAGNKLLLSGDNDRAYYDEVSAMKKYLIKQGIEEKFIVVDPDGISTFDSIERVKDKFGSERIIIVSQKFHLYRALQIADALGLDAYGVPSDQHPDNGQSTYGTREFWARIKDFFQSYSTDLPQPIAESINWIIDKAKPMVKENA